MVDDKWLNAQQAASLLNITLNNLRQIQYRKQLVWKRRQGREVFYLEQDVLAFAEKRKGRKSHKALQSQ